MTMTHELNPRLGNAISFLSDGKRSEDYLLITFWLALGLGENVLSKNNYIQVSTCSQKVQEQGGIKTHEDYFVVENGRKERPETTSAVHTALFRYLIQLVHA